VVGARSALFLPYADLGLIIVDEEHDQAYKQDDGAHYHARDMAVVRAHIAKIPIILASATPSIESRGQRAQGPLSARRAAVAFRRPAHAAYRGDRSAPRPPPRGRFVSPRLPTIFGSAIEKREQALLFLNRRGYAPLTLCRACGHRFACPICDAWLVDQSLPQRLSVINAASRCRARTSVRIARPEEAPVRDRAPASNGMQGRSGATVSRRAPSSMVLSSDLITSIETMPQRAQRNRRRAERRYHHLARSWLARRWNKFPRLNLGLAVVDADLGPEHRRFRAPAERTFSCLI
jgi:primosomal protein N' (replication factor Y)